MIVNPVRYGGGSVKQLKVTVESTYSTNYTASYVKNGEFVSESAYTSGGNNANRRQWEPFLGVSKREKPVIPQLSKSLYKSDGLYSIFFVQDGGIPSRRLTSKEVAA